MKKNIFFAFVLSIFCALPGVVHATRLHTTGFESLSDADEALVTIVNPLTYSTSVKRTGAASLQLNGVITTGTANGTRLIPSGVAVASSTIRFYLYVTQYPNSTTTLMATGPAASHRGNIQISPTGTLIVRDNDNASFGTSSVLSLSTWYRVELKHYHVTGTGKTGIIEVKIDGTTVVSSSAAATASTIAAWEFGINLENESATSGMWYFDDVAINTAAGNNQTGYPGEGSVVNSYPNAVGDFAQGSSSGAGAGWDDVDDHPFDSDTTYWRLQTNNDVLDVNVENSSTIGIGSDATVTLVQLFAVIRGENLTSANTNNVRIKSASGGTVTNATAVSVGTTTWYVNDDGSDHSSRLTATTTPDLLPWTPALIDSMQIGIRAPDADPDLYVTSLWATIEFIPAVVVPPAPPATQHKFNLLKGRILFQNGRIIFK